MFLHDVGLAGCSLHRALHFDSSANAQHSAWHTLAAQENFRRNVSSVQCFLSSEPRPCAELGATGHPAPLRGSSDRKVCQTPEQNPLLLLPLISLGYPTRGYPTQDIPCFLRVVAEGNCTTVVFFKVGKEKKLNRPVACKPDSVYT